MFRCDICGLVSSMGDGMVKEVVATRQKQYYTAYFKILKSFRKQTYQKLFIHHKDEELFDSLKKEGWIFVSEKESFGHEIVKENKVCSRCKTIIGG